MKTPGPFRCFNNIRKALRSQFLDLVQKVLEVDPDKRPTPVDVLHHPFLAIKEEEAKVLNTPEHEVYSIPTCLIVICLLLIASNFIYHKIYYWFKY